MAKFKYIIIALLLVVPLSAKAAYNTITHDSGAQIYLTGTGLNYTLGTDTKVESYVVNAGNVQFVVTTGSVISLTSSNKSNYSWSGTTCSTQNLVCGGSESVLTINCSNTISEHTITLTPGGTCTTGSSAPSAGSSSAPSSAPAPAPAPSAPAPAPIIPLVTTTPAVAEPVKTVVVPETKKLETPEPVEEEKKPESKIMITELGKSPYQPNEMLKFVYQYKNESGKSAPIKVIRQMINSKGKVIKTSTLSKTLKSNAVLKNNVSESLSKLTPGVYTVMIKVTNNKNILLEQNSFNFTVDKLKKKFFVLGSVETPESAINFDGKVLAKVKKSVALPVKLAIKYSYTNATAKKQVARMVREIIDENGKVVSAKAGKWTMAVKETYSQSFTQPLLTNLSAGQYSIRISAYDYTTKELFAQNSLGFAVELK